MPGRNLRMRVLLATLATLSPLGTASSAAGYMHRMTMVCVNPASGARWELHIDFDRATVDSNRAKLEGTAIDWHDAKDGGNYTLDRNSGALRAVFASSTGGYFLYDRCAPKYAR